MPASEVRSVGGAHFPITAYAAYQQGYQMQQRKFDEQAANAAALAMQETIARDKARSEWRKELARDLVIGLVLGVLVGLVWVLG